MAAVKYRGQHQPRRGRAKVARHVRVPWRFGVWGSYPFIGHHNTTLPSICRPRALLEYPAVQGGGASMEYKHFVINAFERVAGKWRAGVSRTGGKALLVNGRRRTKNVEIDRDETTGAAALLLAMAAIRRGIYLDG